LRGDFSGAINPIVCNGFSVFGSVNKSDDCFSLSLKDSNTSGELSIDVKYYIFG